MRALLLGVFLAAMCSVSGCLITQPVQFVGPNGIQDTGSCMCAVCWDRPFCLSNTGESFVRSSETAACPADSPPGAPILVRWEYPFTWWTTVDRVMTDTRGGSTRGSERDLLHG